MDYYRGNSTYKRRNDSRRKSPIVKQEACYVHGKRVEVKKPSKILFPIAYGESRTNRRMLKDKKQCRRVKLKKVAQSDRSRNKSNYALIGE